MQAISRKPPGGHRMAPRSTTYATARADHDVQPPGLNPAGLKSRVCGVGAMTGFEAARDAGTGGAPLHTRDCAVASQQGILIRRKRAALARYCQTWRSGVGDAAPPTA